MKNVLAYYYNFDVDNIIKNEKGYRFSLNGNDYYLLKCDIEKIEQAYMINTILTENGVDSCKLVKNNQNGLYILFGNDYYVLIKLVSNWNKLITIDDILFFNNSTLYINTMDIRKSDFRKLWEEKIDYFEYQVNQFGKKYTCIRSSFGFYSGLVENGILLYNTLPLNDNYQSIVHKRLYSNSTIFDLYNPFNMIIDYRTRDIVEYLKDEYIKDNSNISKIILFFKNNKFEDIDYYTILIRFMYPTFYFDEYERIIFGNKDEEELKDIIKKTNHYDLFLKEIYIILSSLIKIPKIEWLKD